MNQLSFEHYEKLESYLPASLLSVPTAGAAFLVVLGFVIFRYFAMVLPFHAVFYGWRPAFARARQIYPQLPGWREQKFEIKWSLISALIFAATGVLLGVMWELGWTRLYLKFDQYGLWYLPVSWLILLVLHDTYFYWTHVWLHRPGIYEKYHLIHHKSLRPSPWASFSFHPVESLINALWIPVVVAILPLHPVVLIFHLTFMTISAITNHLGFEVLPSSALKYGYGRWLISGTHHAQHHRYFRANYGLFLSFWDHVRGTEHPKFTEEFTRVFTPTHPKKPAPPSPLQDSQHT